MARCTCTRAVRWSAAIWGVALLFLSAWKVLLKDTSPNSIHDSHAHVFNVLPPRLSHTNTGDLERRECNPQLLSYPWTVLELESYYERQLIFFAKPIMQAVKTISLENRWKVKLILNDSSTNVARLESLLSPRKFTILFTSSKILGRPEVHKYMNYSNMLIAAVPNMYRVSGAKKDQYLAFEALLNRHGCSMKSVAIMPRTFLLDDYEQCSAFFHYVTEVNNPLALWVIKTSQGYGGDGVKMFNNVSQLVDQFGSCPNRREYIAQEHVGNMLLVEGRKFDVRALILVAGTRPVMVFYHDGYLRVSIREYDSQATGREVHLTNSHVQITSKGFNPENHFWSHKRFQDYLDKYHSDNGKFVEAVLIPFIQKIGTFVVNSGMDVIERAPSSFQLLGLDFMVSANWRVWFIEANNYPLWPKGQPEINSFISTMGHDMFSLVLGIRQTQSQFRSMDVGDWYRSWKLIWREECPQQYNPCRELT